MQKFDQFVFLRTFNFLYIFKPNNGVLEAVLDEDLVLVRKRTETTSHVEQALLTNEYDLEKDWQQLVIIGSVVFQGKSHGDFFVSGGAGEPCQNFLFIFPFILVHLFLKIIETFLI